MTHLAMDIPDCGIGPKEKIVQLAVEPDSTFLPPRLLALTSDGRIFAHGHVDWEEMLLPKELR